MLSVLKAKSHIFGAVVVLLLLPSLACADSTIYSNLNPDPANLYAAGGPFGVSNTVSSGQYQSVAAPFTPSVNADVTQLDLAMSYFYGGGNNFPGVTLTLVNDASGLPGTNVLFTDFRDIVPIVTFGLGATCCALLTVNVGPGVSVLAGQTYWLVANPSDSNSTDFWQFNNTGVTGWAIDYNFLPPDFTTIPDPTGWTAQSGARPAFAVVGTPTPEPSTLICLLGVLRYSSSSR
jgi:hypothetical protein